MKRLPVSMALSFAVFLSASAEPIDNAERKLVADAFQARLTAFAKTSPGDAGRIEALWTTSNILILPVHKSATDFYKEGFTAADLAEYADVQDELGVVLDAFDELPAGVVTLFRGSGIYVSTREGHGALILSPFLYNAGSKVYTNMRYGAIVEAPVKRGDVLRRLGMVLDTQVTGQYGEFRKKETVPHLKESFEGRRAQFVSEMHSDDETKGFISRAAKADSYWDIGEHFRAFVEDREDFESKADGDPILAFKLKYFEDLFAFDPAHPPTVEQGSEAPGAPMLAEEDILKRFRAELAAYRKEDPRAVERIAKLFEKHDLMILPVSRNANDLYSYGLRLDDISQYVKVMGGLAALFQSLDRIPERLQAVLEGSGFYLSTREGRSYAVLSGFEFNSGRANPQQPHVLRNLRAGFIFERSGEKLYSPDTSTHEIGHVVDRVVRGLYLKDKKVGELRKEFGKRRDEFETLFGTCKEDDFVSAYASSNAQEDFAECFRAYAHEYERFKEVAGKNEKLGTKFKLMEDLFGGAPLPGTVESPDRK